MSRSLLQARWAAIALCAGAVAVSAAPAQAAHDRCDRSAAGGDTTLEVRFGGTSYSVLVYVPEVARRNARLPLVLNLHGSQANGPVQMEVSGLRAVADDEGFLVAAPSGAIPLAPQTPPDPNGSWAWNVPGVPTTAGQLPPPTARDDVQFLSRVIDVVTRRL